MPLDEHPGTTRPRRRRKAVSPAASEFLRKAVRIAKWGGLLAGLAIVAGAFAIFLWTCCRIEPQSDQIAILIRKTGENLKPDEIIATRPGQKGIQLETLPEGRYFYNPFTWDWHYAPITTIPGGKLGVVTRLYGKELPDGEIIAPEGYKGIFEKILVPSKYRINPYAERVEIYDAITIGGDEIGVVVRLAGRDPLYHDLPNEEKNTYIVPDGIKGVQAETLGPGTYYLHPYMYAVKGVSLKSQPLKLQGEDAISFLTEDGFEVVFEGTLEFAIMPDRAAQLIQQVGDMDDTVRKIILPKVRGFSRIEGSKHPAINFIVGETRQRFQTSLQGHLVEQCQRWGIEIRSMVIRNITPPDEVSAILREREVALQNQRKIEQQIEQARSQAELTRQEMLAQQNREKVESETAAIRERIQAEQEQSVLITAGMRKLEVARIEAEAAQLQAEAVLIQAEAERDVVTMQNQAEASVVAALSAAFGGGQNLARYAFFTKTAPMIDSVVSTDRAPGLGGVFQAFSPTARPRPTAVGEEEPQ